ncbi:MAG TPA: DUF2877 domain-containing protein [Jatrophihabitans sp.]|nr:DUF2877 domain-containing protein [Jatrophihabitans sp.]
MLAASQVASYVTVPHAGTPAAIVALLAPNAVRLPIGVCIADDALPARGATVALGAGVLATSDRAWRPVRWWDPRPHVRGDELVAHGELLVDIVRAEPAHSFGMPLSDAFAVARRLGDGDADAALGVIGSGPGLTPAGDDVVAGAFAVLALLGRLDDSFRDAVLTCARTRTTALSAALVAAAGRGEMIPQAARLLTSMAAGDDERVATAATALFAVGSTSGHDLAAGMAGALAALSSASTESTPLSGRRT